MTTGLGLLAIALGVVAGGLLYVATPQQQWRAAGAWPSRWRVVPGALCALASLAVMWPLLAPTEVICAWLTLLMLTMTLAPFLAAWRNARRVRGRT